MALMTPTQNHKILLSLKVAFISSFSAMTFLDRKDSLGIRPEAEIQARICASMAHFLYTAELARMTNHWRMQWAVWVQMVPAF